MALAGLCLSFMALAKSDETYMVYGHVADFDTHAPLYKAKVYFYDGNQALVDSMVVDRTDMNYKEGGFMCNSGVFPAGHYFLKIVHPGYCSPMIPFELSNHNPLPTLFLKKLPADGEKPEQEYVWEPTMLEVLKSSPAYARDTARTERFEYALPSDSMLTQTRKEFRLDSVAGTGDDISRIKNLLYWVHDNIKHNGSNGVPEGPCSLSNIYHASKKNDCGYNCRVLAIALAEAYLSVGIPARYLTCQPKAWDTDADCHVICMAWSDSLGKWVWVDPTFAAYVTDERGLLLHPGEVRYRLQHDMPLTLNPDANWNNEVIQTKEDYLEDYMAKNLYILSANMLQQAEPEGPGSYQHHQGWHAALVPQNTKYSNAWIVTTDEDWFWQAPR